MAITFIEWIGGRSVSNTRDERTKDPSRRQFLRSAGAAAAGLIGLGSSGGQRSALTGEHLARAWSDAVVKFRENYLQFGHGSKFLINSLIKKFPNLKQNPEILLNSAIDEWQNYYNIAYKVKELSENLKNDKTAQEELNRIRVQNPKLDKVIEEINFRGGLDQTVILHAKKFMGEATKKFLHDLLYQLNHALPKGQDVFDFNNGDRNKQMEIINNYERQFLDKAVKQTTI
jgi:hypothetical protein